MMSGTTSKLSTIAVVFSVSPAAIRETSRTWAGQKEA
jgi:hypothetical protein